MVENWDYLGAVEEQRLSDLPAALGVRRKQFQAAEGQIPFRDGPRRARYYGRAAEWRQPRGTWWDRGG